MYDRTEIVMNINRFYSFIKDIQTILDNKHDNHLMRYKKQYVELFQLIVGIEEYQYLIQCMKHSNTHLND